jgi:sulfite reductase alpha subunit-like flavoprotein
MNSNEDKGAEVPIRVRPGYIRLPDSSKPVIMVGPGTGCAMFKAMLEERKALQHSGKLLE